MRAVIHAVKVRGDNLDMTSTLIIALRLICHVNNWEQGNGFDGIGGIKVKRKPYTASYT